MARKGNKTGEWARRHMNDSYVKKAISQGYRSHAVYKFQEINDQDKLLKAGMVVVDLGSAPGGWSQYISRQYGDKCTLIAIDLLDMPPIEHVHFIQGDFQDEDVLAQLDEILDGRKIDLVISDMAPNMSGMNAVDQPRSIYLVELALDMSRRVLAQGGVFASKVFQGEGFDELFRDTRQSFDKVLTRKPKASRPRSREVYLVASGFKGR